MSSWSRLSCRSLIGIFLCFSICMFLIGCTAGTRSDITTGTNQPVSSAVPEISDGSPTPDTQQDVRVIVDPVPYATGPISDYIMPDPGTFFCMQELNQAIQDSANNDAYFFVDISIIPPERYSLLPEEDYLYAGRTLGEWQSLADQGDADAYKTALAGIDEYNALFIPDLEKAFDDTNISECARLKELGYDVFFYDTWQYDFATDDYATMGKIYTSILAGVLSHDQLVHFDANPECGYSFNFVENGDGFVVR